MSLADQLSRSRLRKVDKPKEPPSLLKELNAYSTVDLTKLRATSIPARRFDPSSDQWVPCDPASSAGTLPPKLRVLTFNVWIQQDFLDQRMGALVSILEQEKVDIAALQEATPKHLEQLHAHPYVRRHFSVSGFEGQCSTYKTLILSKIPFASLISSDMPYSGRKVTTGSWRFCAPGGAEQSFALSSVHLTSEANDWKPRMEQLGFLDSRVGPDHDTSVIVGDFNFLFKREEKAIESNGYTDVWHELHPSDPGTTFDSTINHHAASTTMPNFAARLDRVTLKSKVGWRASKISIVGKTPIVPGQLFISDHWGLLTTFKSS